jgi:hypothetical protein
MRTLTSGRRSVAGGALSAIIWTALAVAVPAQQPAAQQAAAQQPAAQQKASPPDFSSDRVGWIATSPDFVAVPGGPSPSRSDPAHPYVPNNAGGQPTFRVADLSNPNLKPWAREVMKRENEKVLSGGIGFTARSSCRPAGVPGFMMFIIEPIFFVQGPKEVLMIHSGNEEVRRIHLDVPHSVNPKPSWYGESVGHYEGDTLVVDTTGLNDKTFIDNYRTPHTEKLHVQERWKLTNDGNMLEVNIRVEDPDTFNEPWSTVQRYRRVQPRELGEEACAENNYGLFDYHIPVADKPDF